jgi:hypothetical protein
MADTKDAEEDKKLTDAEPEVVKAEQESAQESTEPSEAKSKVDTKAWEENAKVAEEANKEKFGHIKNVFRGYWRKKKWTLPLTLLVIIAVVLGVPASRYKVLGLFLKQSFSINVVDKTTSKPISGVTLVLADKTAITNAAGTATLRVPVGPQKLAVSKKYYKATTSKVMVSLIGSNNLLQIHLVATGRQVPVTIADKITGKGLPNVAIAVLGTDTKTDKDGKAIIVLPTTATTQKANLQLAGYNAASATITVTDQVVTDNKFTLTPVGKLYFLSNLSGKIDVIKTNLDGTNRQTVLAGTGNEDPASTSLLASRDWKYLALLAKRDNGQPGIYLINTSDDTVTNIDSGSATASFTLVGWSNDTFVYEVSHSDINSWQSGGLVLKSYDAPSGKLFNIDQTQGEGTSASDYGSTSFSSVYILDNELVYVKNWYSGQFPNHLDGKSASLMSVQPDGSNKKSIQDFPIPAGSQYYSVALAPYEPHAVYVSVPGATSDAPNTYYEYQDAKLTQQTTVTADTFNKLYPTFLVSPSDKQTFWSDVRDNKNALFIGDADANNQKQIASLSDDTPYGWYTDNYVLVSKNGSELFIMPADGSGKAIKVTDYYKPQLTYRGYGGGYGGN